MLEALTDRFLGRRNTDPDSVRRQEGGRKASVESVTDRRHIDWLEHHTPREHAFLLIHWVQRNVDVGQGMLFREAMQEFYSEAINDAGWAPRPWNPVARQMDLICTGGSKPYTWMMTPTGRMKRRRYYPIPAAITQRRAA